MKTIREIDKDLDKWINAAEIILGKSSDNLALLRKERECQKVKKEEKEMTENILKAAKETTKELVEAVNDKVRKFYDIADEIFHTESKIQELVMGNPIVKFDGDKDSRLEKILEMNLSR